MALTCARCGTQNPDGNSFCQACGTPLVAMAPTAPVGPPPGPPPMGAPPAVFGPPPDLPPPSISPYYTPSAGGFQPPVHRTPWVIIVTAVIALVVVMAGCGTALALLNSRKSDQTTTAGLPSPSPAGTPTPIVLTSPTAPPAGGSTQSTTAVSVSVPAGWGATSKDPSITLTNPTGDGSVTISSGLDNPPQTAQQIKDSLDKALTAQFPDTRVCAGTKTTAGVVDGVSGIWWQDCFTATSGAQSFQGAMYIFAGANAGGSIGYGVILFTLEPFMPTFIKEAKPVLDSIRWKLK